MVDTLSRRLSSGNRLQVECGMEAPYAGSCVSVSGKTQRWTGANLHGLFLGVYSTDDDFVLIDVFEVEKNQEGGGVTHGLQRRLCQGCCEGVPKLGILSASASEVPLVTL